MKAKDLFSVTNSYQQDGTCHKIFNVCGLKLKIKKRAKRLLNQGFTPPLRAQYQV